MPVALPAMREAVSFGQSAAKKTLNTKAAIVPQSGSQKKHAPIISQHRGKK